MMNTTERKPTAIPPFNDAAFVKHISEEYRRYIEAGERGELGEGPTSFIRWMRGEYRKPVDVLAVMRRMTAQAAVCRGTGAGCGTQQMEDDEAIAAVAELIEREKAQREALESCERWFKKHSPTAPLINGLGAAEHPMLTMIRSALARVQGGAE